MTTIGRICIFQHWNLSIAKSAGHRIIWSWINNNLLAYMEWLMWMIFRMPIGYCCVFCSSIVIMMNGTFPVFDFVPNSVFNFTLLYSIEYIFQNITCKWEMFGWMTFHLKSFLWFATFNNFIHHNNSKHTNVPTLNYNSERDKITRIFSFRASL